MSNKFVVNEIDKEERIKKHNQKRKSKQRDKMKEEGFEKRIAKSKKENKNWLKNYELVDVSGDELEYYDYDDEL